LEFYANNLNKSEDVRANLDKVGTLLYEDNENSQPSLESFVLTPISIPIDWLVIVGSYLSLSVAIVGVKAKQSTAAATAIAPPLLDLPATAAVSKNSIPGSQHSSPVVAYDSNSIYQVNQSLLQQTSPPNLRLINSVPLLPTPSTMPMLVSTASAVTPPDLGGLSNRQLKEQMSMPPPQIIPTQQISPPQQQQQQQQYQAQTKMYQQNNVNFRQHPYNRPPSAYPNSRNNFYNNNTNTGQTSMYKDSYNRNTNEPSEMIVDLSIDTDKDSSSLGGGSADAKKTSNLDDMDKVSSSDSSDSSRDSESSSDSDSEAKSNACVEDNMDEDEMDDEDHVYSDRAESELVKSYFTLTEASDEKELVEKINSFLVHNDVSFSNLRLNRAPNYKLRIGDLADAASASSGDPLLDETNNELPSTPLDEYLNEKFNPLYSVDFEYKCNLVKNPLLNHYEHSQLATKIEQGKANDLAESYLKNKTFVELFDSSSDFHHLEVEHVNLLDDLFLDLNRSNQAAYDLFNKMFKLNGGNLSRLNRIVADFLLNFGARLLSPEKLRELNLGLSYANMLLTKYDGATASMLVTEFHLQSKLLDLFLGKLLILLNLRKKARFLIKIF
jgi:hypothetical protein